MTTDNVLIVDDDENNLSLFGTYIDSFGFNYDTAEDGQAAVKKLESAPAFRCKHDAKYPLTSKNSPPILPSIENNVLSNIAIGRAQAQHALSTMLGSAESAPNRHQWPDARKEQD